MDGLLLKYLREEPRVTTYVVAGSTAWTQVVGADPMRFAAVLGFDGTDQQWFAFSNGNDLARGIGWDTGAFSQIITEEMIGGAICLPIWGQFAQASRNMVVVTFSYQNHRRRLYDAWITKQLSQFGSL